MRQPKINKERARRAEMAMEAAGYSIISDLLSDLRHLCDRDNLAFHELDRDGHSTYRSEVTPDDIERDVRRMHRRGEYPILSEPQPPLERASSLLIEARDILRAAGKTRATDSAAVALAYIGAREAVAS